MKKGFDKVNYLWYYELQCIFARRFQFVHIFDEDGEIMMQMYMHGKKCTTTIDTNRILVVVVNE